MFLLPVGVVLVVAGELFAIPRSASQALHDSLFPEAPSRPVPCLGAIMALVAIAFVAGLFARTQAGRRVFSTLEETILSRLPVYALLRPTLADMAGDAAGLGQIAPNRWAEAARWAFRAAGRAPRLARRTHAFDRVMGFLWPTRISSWNQISMGSPAASFAATCASAAGTFP
jgi:hypothetical protein